MKNSILFFCFLFFLFGNKNSMAQATFIKDSIYIFEMNDGNIFVGKVKVIEENKIYEVTTSQGVLTINQQDVVVIKKLDASNVKEGQYWPTNPHSSRYFFSPSGYGLRKGEGYYQNAWVLFNQVSYGFSDYFSMGGGIVPTFLFGAGSEFIPVWITPKFNMPYKNGKGAFGVGSILLGVLGSNSGSGVGLVYGTNTFGNRDKQITLGLGFGYDTNEGLSDYPVFNLSGLVRTSKNWAIVTENYFFSLDEFGLLISGGARYMGKRMAMDFGGFIPIFPGIGSLYVLPWLSVSVPFGTRY
jgi:hypothetical protein